MEKKDCLVALRIPSSTRDSLEELMVLRKETNLSAILRKALKDYVDNNLPTNRTDAVPESREITVKLNERGYILLKKLIGLGLITTMAEGIREAIPHYCGKKMDDYTQVESVLRLQEGSGGAGKPGGYPGNPFDGIR